LGAAIEHASGKSYYDYLGEAVFKPAGMTNSDVPPADVSMEGRALGYQRPAGTREWLSAMSQLSYRGDGAGGAFATVDDLGAFVAALRGNRLLDAKHTKLMIEPKVEIWAGKHYGLGATIETYNSSPPSIGHSGGEPGTSTEVWFMPATGYTVIVVSNFDPPTAGQVAAFIRGRLPEKAP
jgi:CubicO group peptidase (beta-lactamase class C family)